MKQSDTILRSPTTPLEKLQSDYLRSMIYDNCSQRTIEYWAMNFFRFNRWANERGIEQVEEVTLETLNRFREHIFHYRNPKTNRPLKFLTQHNYLMVIRRWFTWLYRKRLIDNDVAGHFELPKPEKKLPMKVFTAAEVEKILNQIDVTDPFGIRDRAIIEVFYSTGIRNSELINLDLHDVDAERKVVMIRQGKGRKDRVVPIGDRALKWTRKYIADIRPLLVNPIHNHNALFVSARGRKFGPTYLGFLVRSYKDKAGVKKNGSCHMLRHTTATLMLENGADIRCIQELLGHAKLSTTQTYTHVSISRLREVHAKTHPASCDEKSSSRRRKKK